MNQDPVLEKAAVEKAVATAGKWSRKIGRAAMLRFLQLYEVAMKPSTPGNVKMVIIGALVYVCMPADIVPDVLPAVGYADDMTALGAAFAAASGYVTPEVTAKA